MNAGEFSPRMASRTDFSRYPAGAETLLNCLIDERGGIYRRPGTYFAVEVKNSANETKLVELVPNEDEGYVLELGAGYFRFIKDQGQITCVAHSTTINNGTFATDVTSWTDVDTGSGASAHSASNGGCMSLNGGGTANADIAAREQQVLVAAGDTAKVHVLKFQVIGSYGPVPNQGASAKSGVGGHWVTLRIGTSSGGEQLLADTDFGHGYHLVSFTPGATTIYIRFQHRWQNKAIFVDNVSFHASGALELTNQYTQGQLDAVRWAGSADTHYFVHQDVHPYRLLRRGDRSWSWEQVAFIDGPYLDENIDSTLTLTPGATSGFNQTLTASRALWSSDDVGRLVRFGDGSGEYGWAIVISFTSTTVVNADIIRTLPAGTAQRFFSLGAWCIDQGFPSQIELFKQRSIYAATPSKATTVWMSQAADIENMRPDSRAGSANAIEDDDALTYTVVERRANAIVGLATARDLVILTAGAELPVSSVGAQFTPTDIQVSPQTTYGSNGVDPHSVNSVVVFVQRGGRRVLRLGFDIRLEGYAAEDLTILSEHITRSGIVKMAHQQEPNSIIWCLLGNGTLAALTFHPEQQVAGWTRHEIGGEFDGRHAVVEDIVTIPGSVTMGDNERDELWMIVKRTINGATKRYIEFLEADYDLESPIETCVYADSALMDDNWNTDATKTLTLQGTELATSGDPESDEAAYDAAWEQGDTVTMQATGHAPFLSGDVGEEWLLCYKGEVLAVEITAFTDTDTVTVELLQDAPRNFRNAPIERWLDPDEKVTNLTGATHLAGETVKVLADGAVVDDETVSAGGAITLDEAAGAVVIGFGYESRYKSLKIDSGAALGTGVGRPKRFGDITLGILAATGFRIGPSFDIAKMQAVETRERGDPIGLRAKLWKGEYKISSGGPWDADARICAKSADPRPWFILSLAPEAEVNEVL